MTDAPIMERKYGWRRMLDDVVFACFATSLMAVGFEWIVMPRWLVWFCVPLTIIGWALAVIRFLMWRWRA